MKNAAPKFRKQALQKRTLYAAVSKQRPQLTTGLAAGLHACVLILARVAFNFVLFFWGEGADM